MSEGEADRLFFPDYYPENVSPKTVAKRIRKFVANRQEEKK